jgi:hypothetical protein
MHIWTFKEEFVCVLCKEGKLYRGFVYELYKEEWKFVVVIGVGIWKVLEVGNWLV